MPWQSEGTSWRRPGERVSQVGEAGSPTPRLFLSTVSHRKRVVRSPGHLGRPMTHGVLTGCCSQAGWARASGARPLTAARMTS